MTNTVLVCGSRSIENFATVATALECSPFDVDEIIHGDADGVDTQAGAYSDLHGLECRTFPPNYSKHGDRAPLARNEEMVKRADKVIAVQRGNSSGTEHTKQTAKDHGMRLVMDLPVGDEITAYYYE